MVLSAQRVCVFVTLYVCLSLSHKYVKSQKQEYKVAQSETPDFTIELIDKKWDQIQKGQWLVGFFDDSPESKKLDEDFKVFGMKCQDQNINTARVYPKSAGLHVRFLVTTYPKVYYIKNGVAHEVKQPSRENIINLIKNKAWKDLKPVNFLSNPFSIQMSVLAYLFVHAVNLYNYEDAIVQQYVPYSGATDVAFALTFIVVGTFLGLLLTCVFGLIQIVFFDTKDPEAEEESKENKSGKKPSQKSKGDKSPKAEVVKKSDSEEDKNVRKRK